MRGNYTCSLLVFVDLTALEIAFPAAMNTTSQKCLSQMKDIYYRRQEDIPYSLSPTERLSVKVLVGAASSASHEFCFARHVE